MPNAARLYWRSRTAEPRTSAAWRPRCAMVLDERPANADDLLADAAPTVRGGDIGGTEDDVGKHARCRRRISARSLPTDTAATVWHARLCSSAEADPHLLVRTVTHTLLPTKNPAAGAVIASLIRLAPHMAPDDRAIWTNHIDFVYGQLNGQRGLDTQRAVNRLTSQTSEVSPADLVIALHTFFAFSCEFIANAFATAHPVTFARKIAPSRNIGQLVKNIVTGGMLESMGFLRPMHRFPFDWFLDGLDGTESAAWTSYLRSLRAISDEDYASMADAPDFIGTLYSQTVPKNILHALGEFYTPKWLADYMIQRLKPSTEDTVMDPFCGSGVFLLAAFDRKQHQGCSVQDSLDMLLGIDVNPVSCTMARANLVVSIACRLRQPPARSLNLPVLYADSIGPSLLLAQQRAPSLINPVPSQRLCSSAKYDVDFIQRLHTRWRRRPSTAGYTEVSPRVPAGAGRGAEVDIATPAVRHVAPADCIATNPPWIGWEYQSRSMRAHVQPAWDYYDLCPRNMRQKAFLKEDISTLALVSTWDTLLKERGLSAAVIRTNAMTSALASSGLRRLSLRANSKPINLDHVDVLDEIRVFPSAQTEASVWFVRKDQPTSFPIPCHVWTKDVSRWRPSDRNILRDVLKMTTRAKAAIAPSDPQNRVGRWMIGPRQCIVLSRQTAGASQYRARVGVFTGGANGVYYVNRVRAGDANGRSIYANIVDRAKRQVPECAFEVEDDLVYPVVRGRDLRRWHVANPTMLICPHTSDTRMDAISPRTMAERYPCGFEYLKSMKAILDDRRGFTKWEAQHRERAFYALQRVGAYTFSKYKVCWKYIANEFVAAVVGPDKAGRPILPNDKVVSVAVRDLDEACYLCGILSSSPIRWQIKAHSGGTQMSAGCIDAIRIPTFEKTNSMHQRISSLCRRGHERRLVRSSADIVDILKEIDVCVADLYGWSYKDLTTFQRELGLC